MLLQRSLQWLRQGINHSLKPQNTSHISPKRASSGMYIVRIWEKIDRAITAPQFIMLVILSISAFINWTA